MGSGARCDAHLMGEEELMNLKINASLFITTSVALAMLPSPALASDAYLSDSQRFASENTAPAADGFGRRVSVEGDLMVVGTGLGEALVYRQLADSTWAHEQTLTFGGNATFGMDVATDGTKIAVLDEVYGPKVFKETGTGWVLENVQVVYNSSRLFRRIDLVDSASGSELVVTCIDDGTDPKVLLMDWTYISGLGSWWWWLTTTLNEPAGAGPGFGESVDLNPSQLLIGAPGSGTAYVYGEHPTMGWMPTGYLDPSSTAPYNFGFAVAIDGGLAVVSGIAAVNIYDEGGVALVFQSTTGSGWNEVASLSPPNSTFQRFGHDVAIADEAILVTSPGNPTLQLPGALGRATLYRNLDATWKEIAAFRSSHSSSQTINYSFGLSVAVTDNTVLIGADGGGNSVGSDYSGKVHAFDIDITGAKFWSGSTDGDISDDDNWVGEPGGLDGFFAKYGSVDEHHVTMDDPPSLREIMVRVNTKLDLNSLSSTIGDMFSDRNALSVYGRNQNVGALCELVGPGSLSMDNNGRVGLLDRVGVLAISGDAYAVIDGNLDVGATGSLSLNLTTGTTMTARGGSLRGGLTVPLPDNPAISEGDEFTLLKFMDSSPPAGEDAFVGALLPAVGDNLGLELVYEGGSSAGFLTVKAVAVAMNDLVEFEPPSTLTQPELAIDIVNADINGDGADEVCVLYEGGTGPDQIAIYASNAVGSLEVKHTMVIDGSGSRDITTGDFDNDGNADLAVANFDSLDVSLFFGTGIYDSFTSENAYPSGGRPTCISRVNWDFTGGDELVVGLLIEGSNDDDTGAFEILTYSSNFGSGGGMNGGGANGSPGGVPQVFGDPSDDEDQKDYSFSNADEDGNAVAAKGGSGVLGSGGMFFDVVPVGDGANSIALRDLNGDGIQDLAVAVESTSALALITGTSNGALDDTPFYIPASGATPASLIAEDLDADGKIDLAWVKVNDNGIPVMQIAKNNGGYSFTALETSSDAAHFIMAADVTGTGSIDIVSIKTTNSLNGGPSTSLSLQEQVSCVGDADSNDVVDIEDLLIVIGEWNQTCSDASPCASDFDGNGTINIEDLLIVIGAFGPC